LRNGTSCHTSTQPTRLTLVLLGLAQASLRVVPQPNLHGCNPTAKQQHGPRLGNGVTLYPLPFPLFSCPPWQSYLFSSERPPFSLLAVPLLPKVIELFKECPPYFLGTVPRRSMVAGSGKASLFISHCGNCGVKRSENQEVEGMIDFRASFITSQICSEAILALKASSLV
jgi:hypothetical protein